ncbi:hypothetical protein SAMN02745135_01995 [Caloranaerobacter azorensis DSM 13643]|uniref:HipA-like kinase domain-containing protein n=1 Tax=Caloranaerobacter azorensis DSM 13643 TaxID=1121264 RepID=A0A1M5VLG9_9FIRM|nr:HipA family kinase [Caloranaerobacter azorensis]SHH76081.1 hypothetical protein SAMN02745135_01995 [Caloranaerobacter azorensis DSM 13643]
MDYVHVDKILFPVGNGSTEPLYAFLSNSEYAVIKIFNNTEGNLALVNEYICYKLAKILKLPIPDAGIAYIDNNTEVSANVSITSENYGPCYFSKRLDKVVIVNCSVIKFISNKQDFYRVLLFDHLIYNKDRNVGNLLVSLKSDDHRFYAIDHTHVFKNECIWDGNSLLRGIEDNDYKDTNIIDSNKEVYNYFFQSMFINERVLLETCTDFKSRLTKSLLYDIISDIPKQWNVNSSDLNILVEYLTYRLFHLEDICEVILSNIRR